MAGKLFKYIFLLLMLAISPPTFADERPLVIGDKVVLTEDGLKIKVEQVQGKVAKGTEVRVEDTLHEYFYITIENNGNKISGWVYKDQISLKPTARVGGWVEVTAKVATIKSANGEDVCEVKRGSLLAIEAVDDKSIKVTHLENEKKHSGWLSLASVRLVPTVRKGDYVEITSKEALLKTKLNEVVGLVKRYQQFAIEQFDDGQIMISDDTDNKKISGWLSVEKVRLIPTAHIGDQIIVITDNAPLVVTTELTLKTNSEMVVRENKNEVVVFDFQHDGKSCTAVLPLKSVLRLGGDASVTDKIKIKILGAFDWWADSKVTFSQLAEGRYSVLANEQNMLDKCSAIKTKLDIPLALNQDLQNARTFLESGDIQSSIEEYTTWQKKWPTGPVAPDTKVIKEALLAPSALMAVRFFQARSTMRNITEAELDKNIKDLVPAPFQIAVRKSLELKKEMPELKHIQKIYGAANSSMNAYEELKGNLYRRAFILPGLKEAITVGQVGHVVVLTSDIWKYLDEVKELYVDSRDLFNNFSNSILGSFTSEYNEIMENKSLLLLLAYLLEEKKKTDNFLSLMLNNNPLLDALQKKELKDFRLDYQLFYDQWVNLICIYFFDLPIRTRILCVNLGIDKSKGLFVNNKEAIIKTGESLQNVAAIMTLYKDQNTSILYQDVIKRFKSLLSDSEFNELIAKSKMRPDWFKSLDVADLQRITGGGS